MRELYVSIELNGRQREVGTITGDSEFSARFCYSEDYLNAHDAMPISLSMPPDSLVFRIRDHPIRPNSFTGQ